MEEVWVAVLGSSRCAASIHMESSACGQIRASRIPRIAEIVRIVPEEPANHRDGDNGNTDVGSALSGRFHC